MKRWTWNLFCLFSLLVFVSSVTIWVRSYYVTDEVGQWVMGTSGETLSLGLQSGCGSIKVIRFVVRIDGEEQLPTRWHHEQWEPAVHLIKTDPPDEYTNLRLGGFQLLYAFAKHNWGEVSKQELTIPLWLFLPAAVPPFLWWRKWRKKGGRGFPVSVTEERKASTDFTD